MSARAVDRIREDCSMLLDGKAQALAPLRNGTVAVTGGTGFVGTWLIEMIAALNDLYGFGVSATVIANDTDEFKARRPHLASRKDFTYQKSDVRDLVELPRATQWIVHAAANPDSRFHSSNPVETLSTIADGTMAVLRAADRCSDLKMMLNLSSSLVYGPQPLDLERIPESYSGAPVSGAVSSAYAEAKRYAETLCASFRSQRRVPIVTARPFAFIGPYQSMDTPWAVNNFIRDALNGQAIRVFGDGETVRSYLYPSDMAFWMLRILTGGTSGTTYNLGSREAVTLNELAQQVARHFSPAPEVRLRTAPGTASISRMVPDTTLCEKTLGLTQTVPLARALERTIRWNQAG